MSYTVLARKWRPRRFAEVVGQQHVVKALVNSLSAQRLHHAYLFARYPGCWQDHAGAHPGEGS